MLTHCQTMLLNRPQGNSSLPLHELKDRSDFLVSKKVDVNLSVVDLEWSRTRTMDRKGAPDTKASEHWPMAQSSFFTKPVSVLIHVTSSESSKSSLVTEILRHEYSHGFVFRCVLFFIVFRSIIFRTRALTRSKLHQYRNEPSDCCSDLRASVVALGGSYTRPRLLQRR